MHPLPQGSRCFQPTRAVLFMFALLIGLLTSLLTATSSFAKTESPRLPMAPGSIAGVVRDAEGIPLAGIKIKVYQGFSAEWYVIREVTTTVTGAYKVPVLSAGIYRLQAVDPDQRYGPLYYPHAPSLQGATDVPVAGNHVVSIDLALTPAASITGVVTILNEAVATNGQVSVYTQVDKQWILMSSYAITTTGSYTVSPLPAGTFRLCASTALGYDYFDSCYDAAPQVAQATDVTLQGGETKSNLTITVGLVQYNGVITGVVTADGLGLSDIRVNLYRNYTFGQPLVYTMTNTAGQYTFAGLSDGDYVLEFFDPAAVYALVYQGNQRYGVPTVPIKIEQGATISSVNIALVKGGTISGMIRSSRGLSVSNMPIMLVYSEMYNGNEAWFWNVDATRTDENGRYRIQRLWPDTYWICIGGNVSPDLECYGTSYPGSLDNLGIPVSAGATVTGIDIILGPDFTFYLPTINR